MTPERIAEIRVWLDKYQNDHSGQIYDFSFETYECLHEIERLQKSILTKDIIEKAHNMASAKFYGMAAYCDPGPPYFHDVLWDELVKIIGK